MRKCGMNLGNGLARLKIAGCLLLSFIVSGCAVLAPKERMNYCAPSLLPHTARHMKTAGFWISRLSEPDKVILSGSNIGLLNRVIEDKLKLTVDVTQSALKYDADKIKEELRGVINSFSRRKLFLKDGSLAAGAFYSALERNMNIPRAAKIVQTRFGVVVRYADQRLLPTDDGLYSQRGDIDFDELQNSALDIGTPVAVLNGSQDKEWFNVISPLSSGWVRRENVALCGLSELKSFLGNGNLAVVVVPKAEIFLSRGLTGYSDYLRMGAFLPVKEWGQGESVEVILPWRMMNGEISFRPAYLDKKDVNNGYLPYTARNILEQAFKMLNAPYGWGGMYGEQDCSRFIQEIFATVGIRLPRNSSAQAKVGIKLPGFSGDLSRDEKSRILSGSGSPGRTLLGLKGHIMLFLGEFEGGLYAIHSTWAYRQMIKGKDEVRVINRVAVTELSLGEGSRKGSLLERVISARTVDGTE